MPKSLFRSKSRPEATRRPGRRQEVTRPLLLEPVESRRLLSFAPAVSYATDATASAVVTADFNNDGRLDLVTCANASTGSFSVFLGDGAGGFGAARRTVVGTQLSSMAVADFNHDGRADLVVSDGYYGFDYLAGNGDGTFAPPVFTAGGEVAAVGDFDRDGHGDVLVAQSGPDWEVHIHTFCGDGRGNFASATGQDGYYYGWSGRAAADLDNDGNLDVVTGEGLVFMGNGDGSFRYDWQQQAPLGGGAVATGDFTGDGTLDAVVASSNVISVLRGRGDGTFDAPVTQALSGSTPTGVATADFDGDGRLDVVVSAEDTGAVSVLLGNGDGTLRHAGMLATGTAPSGVAVGDFDRDGRSDVAVSNAASRNVSVLRNDGNWAAPPPPSVRIGDATAVEGNAGARTASFAVTLSAPSGQPVTVRYATVNGTAAAGSDYAASAGTLTFAPGQTTATVAVYVTGDRLAEPNETFYVRLIDPTNASVIDGECVGTILDDEPRISINNVSKAEGHGKTMTFTFTVSLSAAYDQAVTVNFATANGTAVAGSDYQSKTGKLTFAPGETMKTISVTVYGDKQKEASETFFLDLKDASSNALVRVGRGTGTILDDDGF